MAVYTQLHGLLRQADPQDHGQPSRWLTGCLQRVIMLCVDTASLLSHAYLVQDPSTKLDHFLN